VLCGVTSSLRPEQSDSGLIQISQTQVEFLPHHHLPGKLPQVSSQEISQRIQLLPDTTRWNATYYLLVGTDCSCLPPPPRCPEASQEGSAHLHHPMLQIYLENASSKGQHGSISSPGCPRTGLQCSRTAPAPDVPTPGVLLSHLVPSPARLSGPCAPLPHSKPASKATPEVREYSPASPTLLHPQKEENSTFFSF